MFKPILKDKSKNIDSEEMIFLTEKQPYYIIKA